MEGDAEARGSKNVCFDANGVRLGKWSGDETIKNISGSQIHYRWILCNAGTVANHKLDKISVSFFPHICYSRKFHSQYPVSSTTTTRNFFSPRGSYRICIKNNRIGAGFLRPLRVSGIIHERGNPLPPRDTKGLRGRSACNSPLASPSNPMRADVTYFVWT